MNRYIHLYPENEEQQRLRLSYSLRDVHQEAGFHDVIAPFEVTLTEVEPDQQLVNESWQELYVRPPVPKDRIEQFAAAVVAFAYSQGRQGSEEIGFIDHTDDDYELYFPGPSSIPRASQPRSAKSHLKAVK